MPYLVAVSHRTGKEEIYSAGDHESLALRFFNDASDEFLNRDGDVATLVRINEDGSNPLELRRDYYIDQD